MAPCRHAYVVRREQHNPLTLNSVLFYPFQSLVAANNAVAQTVGRQAGGRAERNGLRAKRNSVDKTTEKPLGNIWKIPWNLKFKPTKIKKKNKNTLLHWSQIMVLKHY